MSKAKTKQKKKKKTIKIRVEINVTEKRKMRDSTKLKVGSLKNINNIDKTLARRTKKEDSKY